MLAANADRRRAIDLVDDREYTVRIGVTAVGQPSVEIGEILAVEQDDLFRGHDSG